MLGTINQELLNDLCCPRTRSPLKQCGDWLYTTDSNACLKYPIRNGIPVLLVDAAVKVEQAEFERVVGVSRTDSES